MTLKEIIKGYYGLRGRWFSELTDKEKIYVYFHELLKDGAEITVALDCVKSDPSFIDRQLRSTFSYTEKTVI